MKGLLAKYDLLIDQLDYRFIGDCNDVKTLEKILIVLKSGEEGVFPDLIKFCENRLKQFAPNSRLLNPPEKILNYSQLPENEKSEIVEDLENWSNTLRYQEKEKNYPVKKEKDLPPVRGISLKINSTKEKVNPSNEKNETKNKKCTLRSYSEWEKFDVDGELKKLDTEDKSESTKENQKKGTNNTKLSESIPTSGLSEIECQYIATLEKNKGNEAFKAHDYEEAVLYYSRSLSAFKSTATLNNRAQAHIKMKNYFAAIQDCNEVIAIEPSNVKALYRRGTAYKERGMYDLAMIDLTILLDIDPDNKPAMDQLKEIKQLKIVKPEKKKIIIEEIKTEVAKKLDEDAVEEDKNETCTRMKIEEFTSDENMAKLTCINCNSDEEDDSLQLPQRVKEMLQINNPKKKQTQTLKSAKENEIDKKPVVKTKQKTKEKVKIVEESESGSCAATKKDKMLNNEFIKIEIEEYTKAESPLKSGEKAVNCLEPKKNEDENRKNCSKIEYPTSNSFGTEKSLKYQIKTKFIETTDNSNIKMGKSENYKNTIDLVTTYKPINIEVQDKSLDTFKVEEKENDANSEYMTKSKNEEAKNSVADLKVEKQEDSKSQRYLEKCILRSPEKTRTILSKNNKLQLNANVKDEENKADKIGIKNTLFEITSPNKYPLHKQDEKTLNCVSQVTKGKEVEIEVTEEFGDKLISTLKSTENSPTTIKENFPMCESISSSKGSSTMCAEKNYTDNANINKITKNTIAAKNTDLDDKLAKESGNVLILENNKNETYVNTLKSCTTDEKEFKYHEVDNKVREEHQETYDHSQTKKSQNVVNFPENFIQNTIIKDALKVSEDPELTDDLTSKTINNESENFTSAEMFVLKNGKTLTNKTKNLTIKSDKSKIQPEEASYDKISPYEFTNLWLSSNIVEIDRDKAAEYLARIEPEELPNVISNKIDATMLYALLIAIYKICKMGKHIEGEKYLYHLTKIPRVNIAAMLLSKEEIQSTHNLFSTLDKEQGIHMKYVNTILQV